MQDWYKWNAEVKNQKAMDLERENRKLRDNRDVLRNFLTRIEDQGLVQSRDAKGIVKNVKEILNGH